MSALCRCGGYLWQMTPVRDGAVQVDELVVGCLNCPDPQRASQDRPGETDTHQTAAVGARVRPEVRQVALEEAPGPGGLPATGGAQ